MPNITTRVSFYSRQATIVASRANYTIVSVSHTSDALPVRDLDRPAYREAPQLHGSRHSRAVFYSPELLELRTTIIEAHHVWHLGPGLSEYHRVPVLVVQFQQLGQSCFAVQQAH